MRAYAEYDGKRWRVVVREPSRRVPDAEVEVVGTYRAPRAAVEEAKRWNETHGQP